jgi:large subunit ribosomal protein L45
MPLQDDSSAFAQLTVRLQSTQRFAAYDARGRLLAGDPDAHFPVTDLWVFEMSLRKSVANRWRLAARLNPALK